jgi:hypothetical protein
MYIHVSMQNYGHINAASLRWGPHGIDTSSVHFGIPIRKMSKVLGSAFHHHREALHSCMNTTSDFRSERVRHSFPVFHAFHYNNGHYENEFFLFQGE